MQLLNFQSKEELHSKLNSITDFLSNYVKATANNKISDFVQTLNKYISYMDNFNMDDLKDVVNDIEEDVDINLQGNSGRKEFREVPYIFLY